MPKKYLLFLIYAFFIFEFTYAKDIVDCQDVTAGTSSCNPYILKLIKAEELKYDKDKKKLIVSKTLPVPKKFSMRVISVEELIEKYVNIQDSLRFHLPSEISEEKLKEANVSTTKIQPIVATKKQPKAKQVIIRYGKYKVSKGDTLSSIAKKFGMSKKELLHINIMDEKSKLKIGTKLRVLSEQKIIDAMLKGEYTIVSGDTLLSIAKMFKLKPDELVKFNNIKSTTMIKVGKKLKLPFGHVGQKTETKKILKKKLKYKKKRVKRKKSKMIRVAGKRKLRVTATAYSSHRSQTDSTPFLAAWNNRLRPGMKIIAVSRDMLTRYGMKNGTKVRIGGLPGYYKVRDKMNKRYKKRIDIYMGINRRRALRWGRRSVVIYW